METVQALAVVALAVVALTAADPPAAGPLPTESPAPEPPSPEPSPPDVAEPPAAEPPAAEPSAAEPSAAEPPAVDDSKPDEAPELDAPGGGSAAFEATELAARGHAVVTLLCDRPGCFRLAARATPHATAYCGAVCRSAIRRVLDREQKWLVRGGLRGDRDCIRELARRREASEQGADRSWRDLREHHRQSGHEP